MGWPFLSPMPKLRTIPRAAEKQGKNLPKSLFLLLRANPGVARVPAASHCQRHNIYIDDKIAENPGLFLRHFLTRHIPVLETIWNRQ